MSFVAKLISDYDFVGFLIGLCISLIYGMYRFIKNFDDSRFFSGTWRGELIDIDESSEENADVLNCNMVMYDQKGALMGLNSYYSKKNNGTIIIGSDKLQANTKHFLCSDIKWGRLNIFPKMFGQSSNNHDAILFRIFNIAYTTNDKNVPTVIEINDRKCRYIYKFSIQNRFWKPRVNLDITINGGDASNPKTISGQLYKIR